MPPRLTAIRTMRSLAAVAVFGFPLAGVSFGQVVAVPGPAVVATPPGPLGTVPTPTPADLADLGRFVEGVVDPVNTLDLVVNRTRLILLKEVPLRVQMADEKIAAQNILQPKQLTLIGAKVGTTVMTLWFTDPFNKDKEKVISYLVRVIADPDEKERQNLRLKVLEAEVKKLFPHSSISIGRAGDKIVVSGQVKDVAEGMQILRIVRSESGDDGATEAGSEGNNEQNNGSRNRGNGQNGLENPVQPLNSLGVDRRPNDPTNPAGTPGLESFAAAGGRNIINLLRVAGEQQVMLRVTVAEVNRAAARSIGLNFSIINNQGIPVFSQLTGGLTITNPLLQSAQGLSSLRGTGFGGGGLGGGGFGGGAQSNLPAFIDNGQIPLAINALKTLNYAKSLAEPNLVALNGQTANFQSGGQFPVPVVSGFGGGVAAQGLQGVQFVPFGVQLSFTPVITDRDRIRLQVSANVSTRDLSSGTQIGTSNVAGLNTRNFTTVVEMREGQTLAVAGLIQQNQAAEARRVPFLGDIPMLNRLVSFDQTQAGEQELVVLITPELVRPMNPNEVPACLPGSDIFEPSDCEFYLFGRLESRRAYDFRSPVMTDPQRIARYKRAEQVYIAGPSGHSEPPGLPSVSSVPAPTAPVSVSATEIIGTPIVADSHVMIPQAPIPVEVSGSPIAVPSEPAKASAPRPTPTDTRRMPEPKPITEPKPVPRPVSEPKPVPEVRFLPSARPMPQPITLSQPIPVSVSPALPAPITVSPMAIPAPDTKGPNP